MFSEVTSDLSNHSVSNGCLLHFTFFRIGDIGDKVILVVPVWQNSSMQMLPLYDLRVPI